MRDWKIDVYGYMNREDLERWYRRSSRRSMREGSARKPNAAAHEKSAERGRQDGKKQLGFAALQDDLNTSYSTDDEFSSLDDYDPEVNAQVLLQLIGTQATGNTSSVLLQSASGDGSFAHDPFVQVEGIEGVLSKTDEFCVDQGDTRPVHEEYPKQVIHSWSSNANADKMENEFAFQEDEGIMETHNATGPPGAVWDNGAGAELDYQLSTDIPYEDVEFLGLDKFNSQVRVKGNEGTGEEAHRNDRNTPVSDIYSNGGDTELECCSMELDTEVECSAIDFGMDDHIKGDSGNHRLGASFLSEFFVSQPVAPKARYTRQYFVQLVWQYLKRSIAVARKGVLHRAVGLPTTCNTATEEDRGEDNKGPDWLIKQSIARQVARGEGRGGCYTAQR